MYIEVIVVEWWIRSPIQEDFTKLGICKAYNVNYISVGPISTAAGAWDEISNTHLEGYQEQIILEGLPCQVY